MFKSRPTFAANIFNTHRTKYVSFFVYLLLIDQRIITHVWRCFKMCRTQLAILSLSAMGLSSSRRRRRRPSSIASGWSEMCVTRRHSAALAVGLLCLIIMYIDCSRDGVGKNGGAPSATCRHARRPCVRFNRVLRCNYSSSAANHPVPPSTHVLRLLQYLYGVTCSLYVCYRRRPQLKLQYPLWANNTWRDSCSNYMWGHGGQSVFVRGGGYNLIGGR